MIQNPRHIIISRTDSIGDVVLTLPLCGVLKSKFPGVKITFLGKSYTKPVVNCSTFVDAFINWDELNALSFQDKITRIKQLNADTVVHVFPQKKNWGTIQKSKSKKQNRHKS